MPIFLCEQETDRLIMRKIRQQVQKENIKKKTGDGSDIRWDGEEDFSYSD